MGTLLQRITSLLVYGGSLRLRHYERNCLEGWASSLAIEAQQIFRRQILVLDRYKRSKKAKTLFLFPSGWPSGQPLPSELRFRLREDESRVAQVQMEFPSKSGMRAEAVIVLQHGQITSVEFSKLIPRECWARSVVRNVVSMRDVLAAPQEGLVFGHRELPSELRWLAAVHADGDCRPPRAEHEVTAFLRSFEAKFPQDYEALLRKTNGVSAGPVTIHGIGNTWTIPRPDGPFVSIATVQHAGQLAVKIGDKTSTVYLLASESDEVTPLHDVFLSALRRVTAGLL
jgi:hypothetical protein